jgi:hypothetical protein
MSYIFRFNKADKIINLVKTYPKVSYYFYSGSAYYNNQYNLSGAFTSSVLGVPSGYVSLYEQNVDRSGSINFADPSLPTAGDNPRDPFGYAVATGADPTDYYQGSNPRYATFKVKDGTRINFKTVSTKNFNTEEQMGDVLSEDYPLSASIQKYFYAATDSKFVTSSTDFNTNVTTTGSITYLYALKNTLNHYAVVNPNYQVSSSVRDLTASVVANGATDVGLVTIPTILYGDTIKRGSLDLKFYITGTLVGQLKDENRDGNLIQTGPVGSTGSGSVAGVALYNEGFLVLTGSWDLSDSHTEDYVDPGDPPVPPAWKYFAQTISASAPTTHSSSYFLGYSGSHKIPTMTLFAHAGKGDLNHSNNPTYLSRSATILLSSGSNGYHQNPEAEIKNVVSSSYPDPTGSFAKTTYISKIGISDINKNLIGIAKVAKPVKKTIERDFTFKLKLDI